MHEYLIRGVGVVTIGTGLALISGSNTIPAGHVGYKSLFGKVNEKSYQPGYAFINPLATMVKMNLQKSLIHDELSVTSKEGLKIDIHVNVVYRLPASTSRDIYVNTGINYTNILLVPQIKSSIRNIVSDYEAKDLYNMQARLEIKEKIYKELIHSINNIIIEDVLIDKIILPPGLASAVENKLKAEQESERMIFTLEKERKEAERKQIEAEGIKNFQNTVKQGISKELLEWKGITATEELAKSPNTKIVIVGNTKNGLPIIFSENRQ